MRPRAPRVSISLPSSGSRLKTLPLFRIVGRSLAVLLCLCLAAKSLGAPIGASADQVTGANARTIVSELSQCPAWILVDGGDIKTRAEIVNVCQHLSRVDTQTLRAGVEMFCNKYCSYESPPRDTSNMWCDEAKVFVLVRVAFDIAERYPYDSSMSLGQFFSPRSDNDKYIYLLWPLEKTKDGNLLLTGVFIPRTMAGDVYQGMKDFDFMAKHFKRRARQVAAP